MCRVLAIYELPRTKTAQPWQEAWPGEYFFSEQLKGTGKWVVQNFETISEIIL